MRATQPPPKLIATPHSRRLFLQVCLEVFGADPARVEFGEELDESEDVGLLAARGGLRVGSGDGVKECPGAAAEGVDIGGAVEGG
jgi:hypothetical protein